MDPRNQERRSPGCTGGGGGLGTAGPRGSEAPAPRVAEGPGRLRGCVIYLHCDGVGDGSARGRALMRAFLYTLTEIAPQPEAIILVGDAIRLAGPGAETFESLSLMQEQGVQILLAEQSLGALEDGVEPAVGRAATMHTVLDTMLRAEKVITL